MSTFERLQTHGEATWDYRNPAGQLFQLRADIDDEGNHYLEVYRVDEAHDTQHLYYSMPAPTDVTDLASMFDLTRNRINRSFVH